MNRTQKTGRVAQTRGLSLQPELKKSAEARAFTAGLSFSKYVQILIEHDIKKNLLPAVLAAELKKNFARANKVNTPKASE